MIASAFFFKAVLLCYFAGTALFSFDLWQERHRRQNPSDPNGVSSEEENHAATRSQRLALWVTAAGVLCHTAALILRIGAAGEVPFTSLREALSFFSWAVVIVFFWVEKRYRIYIVGSFALPLAFLFLVSASALPNEIRNVHLTLMGTWLGIHTTLSLLGIVAFAMAFIAGLMYLLQERLLKSKRLGSLYHNLPSLSMLDQWNQQAILVGFPLLTLGMITGAMWSEYATGAFWSLDHPKQWIAIGIWIFYFVVLQGRINAGLRARKAARLAILGFLGAMLIFLTLRPA